MSPGTLDLGRLGYGAASLGNLYRPISDEDALAIVDAAWEGGIRSFDTAPHYGLGLSERRLGRALAGRPREAYVISTKVGRLLEPAPGGADQQDDEGFAVPAAYRRVWDPSRAGVWRSLHESRERLGLEQIDIAYLHDPEVENLHRDLPIGLAALTEAKDAGLTRLIGVGSTSVAALAAAVRTGRCDLIMVAGRLTLLDRSGQELLELCDHHAVGIVNVGVFNSGALAAPAPGPDLPFDYAPIKPERLRQLEQVHEVCARFGVPVAHAALQFASQLPGVVNVTVGAASAEQLQQSLAGLHSTIDPQLWAALAEVPEPRVDPS